MSAIERGLRESVARLEEQGVTTIAFEPPDLAEAEAIFYGIMGAEDQPIFLENLQDDRPIEQLAEEASFLEVAYLILNGELPDADQMKNFTYEVTHHTLVHENIRELMDGFRYDAHPMAIMCGVTGALSAFYHDSTDISNPRHREIAAHRLIAKMPTIAAASYKHSIGEPQVYPSNTLSYTGNLLNMMFSIPCEEYQLDPIAERALDLIFILHIDHEQNCSTATGHIVSSNDSSGASRSWRSSNASRIFSHNRIAPR